MKLDLELIDRLAELSRLEFNEAEKEAIKADLEQILTFMEKLNEVDTQNVEPLIHVNDIHNVVREDVVCDTLPREEVLQNAPMRDSDYFKVPKVIDQTQSAG